MSFNSKEPLYLNYLKFMRVFRGTVDTDETASSVQSEKEEFTFSVPHSKQGLVTLTSSLKTHTLLTPQDFESHLPLGWKNHGGLTFMVKKERSSSGNIRVEAGVQLAEGNNLQIADDFSVAQCAGFLETPEAHSSWAKFLTEANQKNTENNDVIFHVARMDGRPVAGAIAVKSQMCKGIYGVATNPKYRKRGLGTLLLNQILHDSAVEEIVGLQVETESYAHKYYRKLGFEDIYELRRFKNEN